MATFVLVPGAFHGGWCYARVADILRAQQHDVYALTLSGLGERAHLASQAINLSTHVEDVVAVMKTNDLKDVILCGHSYGGMVITAVAGRIPERIRTLFYLDGCVPDDGQSHLDLVGKETALRVLDATGESGILVASPGAAAFRVNAADREWVDRLCTPHPISCFIQKLRLTGREALVPHRTFVLCERYRSIFQAIRNRVQGLPGWKVASIGCGHDAMIDAPDAVASLLLDELQR